jgi:hypothetical protein
MARLDWNRIGMELTRTAKGSPNTGTDTSRKHPAAEALVMVEEEAISLSGAHRLRQPPASIMRRLALRTPCKSTSRRPLPMMLIQRPESIAIR